MGTKRYATQEEPANDLRQRLIYTDGGVERLFASEDRHQQLLNHTISHEDAAYFGWVRSSSAAVCRKGFIPANCRSITPGGKDDLKV